MALYLGKNKAARCSITDILGQPYYIDTRQIKNFSYFCYNNTRLDIVDRFDTSNGTDFSYMFYGCNSLISAPQLDTSNGTDFSSMFYGCNSLISVPQLDISNGIRISNVFQNCMNLQSVSLTKARIDFNTGVFTGCTALTNVTIGEGWNTSIYLHYSNNLTQECLHKMIENFADLTGQTAKTFRIGTTNMAKIDAEHITMLDNKNWDYQ